MESWRIANFDFRLSFVRPWLQEISLFDDLTPHGAAMNMAIDEALLTVIPGPLLRVYRWDKPAVSFGYFERWKPIRDAFPHREPVRRWTGGGIVLHGEDFTYSLLIPRSYSAAGPNAAQSYAIIHGALCRALADAGFPAQSAASSSAKLSQACFENPVVHDVLIAGHKVAGGAQRRTRAGLIHQGSIQQINLPSQFGGQFASRLAAVVHAGEFDVPASAEKLVSEKYGTAAWIEKW